MIWDGAVGVALHVALGLAMTVHGHVGRNHHACFGGRYDHYSEKSVRAPEGTRVQGNPPDEDDAVWHNLKVLFRKTPAFHVR